MNDSPQSSRRRWITLGEIIALAALAVSALGVWIAWKSTNEDKPTRIVEQKQPIPLMLRGRVQDDGRRIEISPVESSHALESLTVTIAGVSPIELGADGVLRASDLESAVEDRDKDRKGSHNLPVQIDARYVEAGADRRSRATYVLHYRWEGGGLFSGHSLRLVGFSRG